MGYTISTTISSRLSSKAEISGAIESIGFSASIEASVERVTSEGQQTQLTLKYASTIPAGADFWVCQRSVFLNQYHADRAVRIWDSDLKANGLECKADSSK